MEPNEKMSLQSILQEIQDLLEEGLVDQAEESIDKAIRVHCKDPDVLKKFGILLMERSQFEKARDVFIKLVLIRPSEESDLLLSECCIASGWYDHASIVLDRLISNDSGTQAKAYSLRASLHTQDEEWGQAIVVYKLGLKTHPDDTNLYGGLLKARLHEGLFEGPEQLEILCQQILELDPDDEIANQKLRELVEERESIRKETEIQQAALTRKYAFWQSDDYDTFCGIPEERIPETFVSVIVPVLNDEAHLQPHLENLLSQNLPRGIEILVVDHGSNENEASIVDFFQDDRFPVRYVNVGLCEKVEALNRGMKSAKGEYVIITNPGNTLREDAITRMVKAFASKAGCKIVFGDWIQSSLPNDTFTNPHILKSVHHEPFDPRQVLRIPVATGPVMIQRDWVSELLFFHTDKSAALHEFVTRSIIAGGIVMHIPEILELRFLTKPEANETAKKEIGDIRSTHFEEFPIHKIYAINETDKSELADAWTAYGLWMLEEISGPGEVYPEDELDLAMLCFQRALDFNPCHEIGIQNLAIVSSMLGKLEEVLGHVENLPQFARKNVLSDIEAYRRNFVRIEIPLVHPIRSFTDEWTAKSAIPGFENPFISSGNKSKAPLSHLPEIQTETTIRWVGDFYNESELSEASIEWVQCLSNSEKAGLCHAGLETTRSYLHGLPDATRQRLKLLQSRYGSLTQGIAIYHGIDRSTKLLPDADYHIGIGHCDSSRLSREIVTFYNQLDEVWTSNDYIQEVFLNSGVEKRKLRRINLAVDELIFKPQTGTDNCELKAQRFNILTFVDDPRRCGLDLTLKAFEKIKSETTDVSLTIYPVNVHGDESVNSIKHFLDEHFPHYDSSNIQIFEGVTSWDHQVQSLHSASVVCLPYRHDSFGTHVLRSVLSHTPVVTTELGGSGDVLKDADIQLISAEYCQQPQFQDPLGNWFEPNASEVGEILSWILNNKEQAADQTVRLAESIRSRNSAIAVRDQLATRFQEIESKLHLPVLEPVSIHTPNSTDSNSEENETNSLGLTVFLDGETTGFQSQAIFNRHFSKELQNQSSFTIQNRTQSQEDEYSGPGIFIRNLNQPRFSKPSRGRWIHMADWSLSRIPQDWVKRLAHVDEIWVNSEYQRRAYVDSGIDPSKLVTVPVGVDTNVFKKGVPAIEWDARKTYKFLFVGDGHWQGGADLLFAAYYESFKGKKNVELVIVDTEDSANESRTSLRNLSDQFSSKLDAPQIRYLDKAFSDPELASIYAACDCFVFPYRCESMGIHILEAMACGLPVIVTGGGAADDFVSDDLGYRVPAVRRWVGNQMTDVRLVGRGYFLESDIQALGAEMTHVHYHHTRSRATGDSAADWVAQNRTWKQSTTIALKRIQLLASKPIQKVSSKESAPQFSKFWTQFEELVQAKSFEKGWEYLVSAIQRNPFHPDAIHGLLQMCQSQKWNYPAASLQQWFSRWISEEALKDIQMSSIDTNAGEPSPDWLELPEVVDETSQLPKLTLVFEGSTYAEGIQRALSPLSKIAHQIIISNDDISPDFGLLDNMEAEWVKKIEGTSIEDQRNAIVEKASGDWILFLQPGELIEESQMTHLVNALLSAGTSACSFPRMTYYSDGSKKHELVMRLFRNVPGFSFSGESFENLHSEWYAHNERWGLKVSHESLYLRVEEEVPSTLSNINQERRSKLEALVAESPDDPRIRLNLAEELDSTGFRKDAEEQYQEIVHLLMDQPHDPNTPAIIENCFTHLAQIYFDNSHWDKVIELFSHPIVRKNGLTASMHYLKGKAFLGLSACDEAIAEFTKAYQKKNIGGYSLPLDEFENDSLEDKISDIISNAGFPNSAKTWNDISKDFQSPIDRGQVEKPAASHDLVPLS